MVSNEVYNEVSKNIAELEAESRELVIKNMPKFERGIAEASLEQEEKVWAELSAVFKKYNITPSVVPAIASANQPSENSARPNLVCAGIKTSITYIVTPIDVDGRDGKMPEAVMKELEAIKEKIVVEQKKLMENDKE